MRKNNNRADQKNASPSIDWNAVADKLKTVTPKIFNPDDVLMAGRDGLYAEASTAEICIRDKNDKLLWKLIPIDPTERVRWQYEALTFGVN